MRPACDTCGCPKTEVLHFGTMKWDYVDDCPRCRANKELRVEIGEGTALRFTSEDYKTYDYIEITPEIAKTARYAGIMQLTPEGVVAVFYDLRTGASYGQPV